MDVLRSILFINIRLYSVALCKILAVLVIFIIKVERSDVRLFVAFTRVKMRSIGLISIFCVGI